jgi:hypothetical protein
VYVNWDTPFLETSSVLPSADKRHLSPATMVGEKVCTAAKFPSGVIL